MLKNTLRALRFVPWMTALVVVLAGLQLRYSWSWELWGDSRGWDRAVGAVSSLVSHTDTDHFTNNIIGGVVVLTAVELLVGRRWFLVLVGASAFDAWVMTEHHSVIQGSSGLVLAAAGLLLATFPRALAGLKRREMTRTDQACFTATLISLVMPIVAFFDDLRRYGENDGVNHGAHMRAEVFGVLLGAGLGFWRWHRTRALRRSAKHPKSHEAVLPEVPKDTSCTPQAVRS